MLRVYVNGKLECEDSQVESESYEFKPRDTGKFIAGVLIPDDVEVTEIKGHRGPWLYRVDIFTRTLEESEAVYLRSRLDGLRSMLEDREELTGPEQPDWEAIEAEVARLEAELAG